MEIERKYFKHYRYTMQDLFFMGLTHRKGDLLPYSRRVTFWEPATKGGQTQCVLELDDGKVIVGIAYCSKEDNFCYKIGRKVAEGRAMEMLKRWQQDEQDMKDIFAKDLQNE